MIQAMKKSMALCRKDIRVNVVSLGFIATPTLLMAADRLSLVQLT